MNKVMVVDDDSTMVSLLKTLLELDGFEVAASNRDLDVLENIREEKPDVVLMDVYLTNEDGIELLTKIRTSADLSDLVVVMTSGMNVSEQCLLAGANAFLLKPYNPNQLLQVIQDQLDPE